MRILTIPIKKTIFQLNIFGTNRNLQMNTFDQTLDAVMSLSQNERESLVEILQQRRIEEWRNETAAMVKESAIMYKTGQILPQTADEVIETLHSSLRLSDE